jgi:hypothetical protein
MPGTGQVEELVVRDLSKPLALKLIHRTIHIPEMNR